MKRGLLVVVESGVATSLDWWSQLKVSGDAVILQVTPDEGPTHELMVAQLGALAEAQDMFAAINERVLLRARCFDVRDWIVSISMKG